MGEETPEISPETSPDWSNIIKNLYYDENPVFVPSEPTLPTLQVFPPKMASKAEDAPTQTGREKPITIEPAVSPDNPAAALGAGAKPKVLPQTIVGAEGMPATEAALFMALQPHLAQHMPKQVIYDWMKTQRNIQLPLTQEALASALRFARESKPKLQIPDPNLNPPPPIPLPVTQPQPVPASTAAPVTVTTSTTTPVNSTANVPPVDWQAQMTRLLNAQHDLAAQISVLAAQSEAERQRLDETTGTAMDAWNTANIHALGLKVPGLYHLPSKPVIAPPAPRRYIPKLLPYNAQKETFRAYLSRYENYCDSNGLDEVARKQELVSTAAGAVDRITMRKPLQQWHLEELLQECRERLCEHWTTPQLEQALYCLAVEPSDDPETIMRKVEDILEKADIDRVPVWQLEQLQCEHFMRLIHVHVPMHTYVRRRLGASRDPNRALSMAKEYLRDKGDENVYITDLIKKQLQLQPQNPITATPQPWTPFSYVPQPGVPPKKGISMGLAGIPQPAVAAHYQPVIQEEGEPTADYMRRFLAANDEVSKDELIRRLNDCERLKRDLHQAGVPDKFKKNRQSDYDNPSDRGRGRGRGRGYPPRNASQSQPPAYRKDEKEFTPRKTFDKNGKPRRPDNRFRGKPPEKRYRKVETEVNGTVQVHFVSDDEEEPENLEAESEYEEEPPE